MDVVLLPLNHKIHFMQTTVKHFTEHNVDEAFKLARATKKAVLIDFWSVGCKGCQRMEELTYEDESVQEYLEQNYVLVKYNTGNLTKAFSDKYLVHALIWTPALFMYTPDGRVIRQVAGYLSPHQFIAELTLGKAMLQVRIGQPAAAIPLLQELPYSSEYPSLHQEALYWSGVAAFFAARKDFDALVPYWQELRSSYPGSVWAEKADFLPA